MVHDKTCGKRAKKTKPQMSRIVDLAGHKFDMLTVIKYHSKDKFGRARWLCKCDCGNESIAQSGNLRTGISKSCGCKINKPSKHRRNYDGLIFGRLKVLYSERVKGKTYCFCECLCGNNIRVWAGRLPNGHTQSCGCYKNEVLKENQKKLSLRLTGKFGADSIRYDSSISEEERVKRRPFSQKKWSKKILEIHNFTCVKCYKRGTKLDAHHLDGYRNNTEKRELISNGVCLCKNCHKDYHSIYGIKNTKEFDFHKWIGAPEYTIMEEDLMQKLPKTGLLSDVVDSIFRYKKSNHREDLEKAAWYLNRAIQNLKE